MALLWLWYDFAMNRTIRNNNDNFLRIVKSGITNYSGIFIFARLRSFAATSRKRSVSVLMPRICTGFYLCDEDDGGAGIKAGDCAGCDSPGVSLPKYDISCLI